MVGEAERTRRAGSFTPSHGDGIETAGAREGSGRERNAGEGQNGGQTAGRAGSLP